MGKDWRERWVTCSMDMHFPRSDLDSALQLLHSVVGLTEARKGCRACTVRQDAADPRRVLYREAWDTRSAFRAHVRSEEFRRVLLAMDMCYEEPQVLVENLSGPKGIAHLLALRSGGEGKRADRCG